MSLKDIFYLEGEQMSDGKTGRARQNLTFARGHSHKV